MSDGYYAHREHMPFVVLLLAGAIIAAFLLTGQYDLRTVNQLAVDYGIIPIRYDASGPGHTQTSAMRSCLCSRMSSFMAACFTF